MNHTDTIGSKPHQYGGCTFADSNASELIIIDHLAMSTTPERVGGKGASLARLALLGYPVPRFFCIPRETLAAIAAGTVSVPTLLAAVRQACNLLGMFDCPLAIRSSATCEDGQKHSFAGMFSSHLNILGADRLEAAIAAVHASAHTPAVEAYGRLVGLTATPEMAIVVQEMVAAEISGVAFSRDPTGASSNRILVESVFGLGEGLVSGDLNADRGSVERYDPAQWWIEEGKQDEVYVTDPRGGTLKETMQTAPHSTPSLTPELLARVARLCMDIELDFAAATTPNGADGAGEGDTAPRFDHSRCAIDMEWCVKGEQLFVLQARPVTVIAPGREHQPANAPVDQPSSAFASASCDLDEPVLWDNANIVESYAGVVLPLSFSHARHSYRQVYKEFCRVMGVPSSTVRAEADLFDNMLGLLRGRVYYNLLNWYRLLSLFPNAERSAGFMEVMMGVKEQLGATAADKFLAGSRPPYRPTALRKIVLAAIAIYRLLTLKPRMARFEAQVKATCDRGMKKDIASLKLSAQLAVYDELCREFLANWQAPIINDMRCMLFFGLLRRLGSAWVGTNFDVNQAVIGRVALDSAEPVRRLQTLGRQLADGVIPGLNWLETVVPESAMAELRRRPELARLAECVDEYLRDFGYRCPEEQKLEAKDLYVDPTPLFQTLRAFVRQHQPEANASSQDHHSASPIGPTVLRVLPKPKKWLLNLLILHTARAIADRERLRLLRGRTFAVARRIFRAMGERLTAVQALSNSDDIFYLTIDELRDAVRGHGASGNLAALTTLRKQEYASYQVDPAPPERFVTRGLPANHILGSSPNRRADSARSESQSTDSTWSGTPCFPGLVTGKALIARNFSEASPLNGEILIARSTDPGWVVLFPLCAALIIERGSLLSHSAVVARELGIPTIVGVSGITDALRSGTLIRIDAARGMIMLA